MCKCFKPVLQSRNYLFLAPAPSLSKMLDPAPAVCTLYSVQYILQPKQSVLWSRSWLEPDFLAGAGAGEKALAPQSSNNS